MLYIILVVAFFGGGFLFSRIVRLERHVRQLTARVSEMASVVDTYKAEKATADAAAKEEKEKFMEAQRRMTEGMANILNYAPEVMTIKGAG